MEIVFALLAHSGPETVRGLVRTIVAAGHRMVIHYDAKVSEAHYRVLSDEFGKNDAVRFAPRVKVGWGEWSVVQATLNCLETIEKANWEPDYVYLMSGMDFPVRSSAELVSFLDRNKGDEFIESVPSDSVRWVKSGPQAERYQYRWYFNWRARPHLTDRVFNWQRQLGLRRRFVRNFVPHLGSQWWVLTWATLKEILKIAREPDVIRFFKTTLVPDELFFQTLVRVVVADDRVIGCSLTLYQFTDYGYPVVYHKDHLQYLVRQNFFMARKLSSNTMDLRQLLEPYWTGQKLAKPFDDNDVGIRSTEYEDWRMAYRDGVPGVPLIGAAGSDWASARRTAPTHLVVIGTSTEELRFVHRLLSHSPDLHMHGQLFHPLEIEFADDAKSFASYERGDVALRDMGTLDFLADVVRAEPGKTTGFLLRWEQAHGVTEILFKQPNVRLVLVRGNPLVSFSENLAGRPPSLDQSFDSEAFSQVPAEAAVNRFRVFLKEYRSYTHWLDQLVASSGKVRPKGWMGQFDPMQIGPNWLTRLEGCVGASLGITAEIFEAERVRARTAIEARAQAAEKLLVSGGVDPVVFSVLRDSDNPMLAVSLM